MELAEPEELSKVGASELCWWGVAREAHPHERAEGQSRAEGRGEGTARWGGTWRTGSCGTCASWHGVGAGRRWSGSWVEAEGADGCDPRAGAAATHRAREEQPQQRGAQVVWGVAGCANRGLHLYPVPTVQPLFLRDPIGTVHRRFLKPSV